MPEEAVGADALDVELDAKLYGDTIPGAAGAKPARKSFRAALTQIVIADVSMSVDNVLAVAGTARDHVWVLIIGLALSVALMGLAATFIAKLLKRFPWISYIGLLLIAYVALKMIWDGAWEVYHATQGAGSDVGDRGCRARSAAMRPYRLRRIEKQLLVESPFHRQAVGRQIATRAPGREAHCGRRNQTLPSCRFGTASLDSIARPQQTIRASCSMWARYIRRLGVRRKLG